MPGDIEDIVDATHDPVVAVGVAVRGISGDVIAILKAMPIRFQIPPVIAPDRTQHRRPGPLDDQITAGIGFFDGPTFVVDDVREYPRQRARARSGLGRRDARDRRNHDRACFGLPPGIDDRATFLADDAVVPHPGFGIDRLADGAEEPQFRQLVAARYVVAEPHERAYGGRRRVENRDAVRFADLPEAPAVGVIRRALVHHDRRARGERSISDIGVTGDPDDIRGTPEHVVFLQIEAPAARQLGIQQIAAARMLDALRFSRRSGRIQQKQGILGIDPFRFAMRIVTLHEVVPPVIARGQHLALAAESCINDHALYRLAALGQGFVDRAF